MGFIDKLLNRFKMERGRVRQDTGRATGDPYLEASGRAERVEGATRQVVTNGLVIEQPDPALRTMTQPGHAITLP